MFEAIQKWSDMMKVDPPTAIAGSELATDDKMFLPMPTSVVTWAGVLHAVEHLDAFVKFFTTSQIAYPTAYYSLLRSALIGGASALWVIGPDDPLLRQRRALTIAVDDLRHQRKSGKPAREFAEDATIDRQMELIDKRLAEAIEAAERAGMENAAKADRWQLQTTDIIEAAAGYLPKESAIKMSAAALLLWHTQSQIAHSAPSARLQSVNRDSYYRAADGTLVGRSVLDLDTLLLALSAAVLYVNQAITLFRQRAGVNAS